MTPDAERQSPEELLLSLQVYQEELLAQNQELRMVQEQLEQSRESYATLYEMAPVGYFTVDGGTVVQQVNQTACTFLHVPRSRLIGGTLTRFVPAPERFALRHLVNHCLKADTRPVSELTLVPRGRAQPLRVQVSCHRAPNQAGHVFMAMMNVTELFAMRQTLAQAQARHDAVVSASQDAIILVGRRGAIEGFNAAAEAMFGADLSGRSLESLLLRLPGLSDLGLHLDGSYFPVEVSGGPVPGRSESIYVVRDLTRRKLLEHQVLEAAELQRRQLGRDLHDGISQHLAGVTMLAQTLDRKLSQPETRRIVDLLQKVLQQTRDLARGQYPASLEHQGLQAALVELAHQQETLFGVPCSTFVNAIPVKDPTMAINLYRLAQEATNNAMKHAAATQVHLRWERIGDEVLLEVSDDGCGFDPATVTEGLGLGIMRHRAEVLRARFDLASRPAAGTIMRCRLSAAQVADEASLGGGSTSRPTSVPSSRLGRQ